MHRRALLTTSAFAIAAGALAACSSIQSFLGNPTTAPTQLAADTNLIASGLSAAVVSLQAIPGLSPAALIKVQSDLALVQADAQKIAVATVPTSSSLVQEIAQGVQAIADVALPVIPNGSAIVAVINAAVSLLPVILAAAGVASAKLRYKAIYDAPASRLILTTEAAKH